MKCKTLLLLSSVISFALFSCSKSNQPPRIDEADTTNLKIISFNNPAQLGHQLTMVAKGFGNDTNKIYFRFADTKPVRASYIDTAKSMIGVVIPRYAHPGKITLTVGSDSVQSIDALEFEMSIANYRPDTAAIGDTLKITGYGFNDDMFVTLPGRIINNSIPPIKVTPNEVWCIIPADISLGRVGVRSKDDSVWDMVLEKFFIYRRRITFDSNTLPRTAKVGDVIKITGDFEERLENEIFVIFGTSKPVRYHTMSKTEITVKIPQDATTGKVTIFSAYSRASATSASILTILP